MNYSLVNDVADLPTGMDFKHINTWNIEVWKKSRCIETKWICKFERHAIDLSNAGLAFEAHKVLHVHRHLTVWKRVFASGACWVGRVICLPPKHDMQQYAIDIQWTSCFLSHDSCMFLSHHSIKANNYMLSLACNLFCLLNELWNRLQHGRSADRGSSTFLGRLTVCALNRGFAVCRRPIIKHTHRTA